jgi:hypothetical protein
VKPIFDTSQTTSTKKTKKKTAPKVAAPSPLVVPKPAVSSEKTLYVGDRPWTKKVKGVKSWLGTGSSLVRADVAAPAMTFPDYHAKFTETVSSDDVGVLDLVRTITDHKPVPFVRRDAVKTKHEFGKKQVTIELAIFEAADPAKDDRLFFIDSALIDNVETFYAHPTVEKIEKVVNSAKVEDVTMIVAPYRVNVVGPLYRRALRKLGRKK